MCNEGELLEKFNIQLAPIPMPELTEAVAKAKAEKTEVDKAVAYIRSHMDVRIKDDEVENVAGLYVAMKGLMEKYGCNAGAIQCWNALQGELGVMPCAANAMLNEIGIPMVCETDIHGAITALLVEAAALDGTRSFFADWTIRHPDIENGELLQHCGPWPISVAKETPKLTYPLAFDYPGTDGRSQTRRYQPGALRRRQRRIFPASRQRQGRRWTGRHGHLPLGRSRQHQTVGS